MDDAHDAQPEQSPYVRLPWALVAGGLVGVLLVALGLGLFATRYLRPQATVIPTPVSPTVPVAATAATAAVAAPPASTTVPAPTAAPTPTRPPTPMPLSPLTVSGSTATPPPATRQITPLGSETTTVVTPGATVSPQLTAEIREAYEKYWQVRAEALFAMDGSHLAEVMAGQHLNDVQDRIAELRSEGHTIETDVDHNYVVFEASPEDAKVADSYTDNSVYVDPQTHVRLTTATGEKLDEVYILSKIDGLWKVVTLVRSS